MKGKHFIDISRTAEFAGEEISFSVASFYEGEADCAELFSAASEDCTKMTFPYALGKAYPSCAEYDAERFFGACRVVKAKGYLTAAWIENMALYKCERLLIKGGGKSRLERTAAEEIVAQGVKIVGIDAPEIAFEPQRDEVRKILLAGDCIILENLNLEEAEADNYFLMSAPVLTDNTAVSPCRAVLVRDYLYWND